MGIVFTRFCFTVTYRPGTKNTKADVLSRQTEETFQSISKKEGKFVLIYLNKKSHLLTWLFDHIITCSVPKSRINDHFYSHCN